MLSNMEHQDDKIEREIKMARFKRLERSNDKLINILMYKLNIIYVCSVEWIYNGYYAYTRYNILII